MTLDYAAGVTAPIERVLAGDHELGQDVFFPDGSRSQATFIVGLVAGGLSTLLGSSLASSLVTRRYG